MLVVFYCKEKNCKHIHIRTDERDKTEHAFCPRCNSRMRFISDFTTWATSDCNERKELIKNSLIVSYKHGINNCGKKVITINQIKNPEVYYEMKSLYEQQAVLKAENKNLKILADNYKNSYVKWKERGIIYHDELWKILSYYEPEKYSRHSPCKKE